MLEIGSKIDDARVDGSLRHFTEDLNHYAELGIKAVELPPHGLDVIRNGRLDMRRTGRVREILKAYCFRYSLHSPDPINLMDMDNHEIHVSVLRSSLEFASEIGAGVVVYHPGRFVPEERFPLNENTELSCSEKERLLNIEARVVTALAEEYPGVTICMENARPYLFHSPYSYAERLDTLKQQVLRINMNNVKINLDFGHLFLASGLYGFDPVEAVNQVNKLIGHTHIHDNCGKADFYHEKQQTRLIPFGRGDSHMPVGWGEIPFKDILSRFIASYGGIFMMELRSRYFEHIAESADNLERIVTGMLCNEPPRRTDISGRGILKSPLT